MLGIQGSSQHLWFCTCVCIMNCICVCIMTCIWVCTGCLKKTDFYRSVYLQIELPICHKQFITENLAACDREGIQSANAHFGKTQFFRHPRIMTCICVCIMSCICFCMFFSICGDEGEGLIKCRVFRDPDNTSGGS